MDPSLAACTLGWRPRIPVATRNDPTVSIEVMASCARPWKVLEAFVTVSQPQADGIGGIPLACTGRPQTFTVTVTSFDQAFVPGDAHANALVLVERRGDTRDAQDSEVVRVS